MALAFCPGCGDEMEREFRQAAVGGVETGLNSIVDGLLDGVFAVAAPDTTADATSTTDTGTTGTTGS